ncbi:alpha/beta hydrolase [Catenuloplanes atrovinosus]|uniref:Pimeloyl-ACP methyl ester carboxylesterase n=1 Tax=Catenuloplanes atrovinosus TaxID=137266 RepID=A0AAE3YJW4_9ACTN|nr:alpha/beta hydrolase [Catenuloplanes atrovinosus]MDR7274835.1 pimeloyl-ACP methyl ester carboxylesterase [Catenuloplanes atrovinosus]
MGRVWKKAALAGMTTVLLTAAGGIAVAATAGLGDFYDQRPDWAACDFDAAVECASIAVPLDYARPGERRISIAVSRQRASDPALRRGVLLANPGGPGGSGLLDLGPDGELVSWPAQRFAGTPLNRYYDLIGFDPRGVGRSTPLSCEEPDLPRPPVSRPVTADAFDQRVAWARAAEEGCARVGGDLRPHITTRDTARDMDVIRGVLGEDRISYVGYSYGTYLGAVYGTMFPRRLHRSVLDSAVGADLDWRKTSMAGAIAARRNVDQWAAWAARRHGHYDLGTSPAAVLATVEATSARLATADGGTSRARFDQAIGFESDLRGKWARLAELVRDTRDTGVFDPPPPPGPEGDTSVVTGYLPVNQTIHCETAWPADLEVYRRDAAVFAERYPYGAGPATALPDPCTFRSYTPAEQPTRLRRDGYPAGLVVQAEGDIQTPYPGGVTMAERLGNRLITVADDGNHGQYARRGNTCVDTAVTAYLLDGTLPAPHLTCPGQPRPDVPADPR